MNTFWYCHMVGSPNPPIFKHPSFESAKIEAIRLSKQFNREVLVLQVIASYAPSKDYVETIYGDGLPF